MTSNPFQRLAPFIQEYIYTHGWNELRTVQVEACRVMFETDRHLLLATGTASGKTEAAFLPILTLLHEQPSETIGALYIGPTKALINDQFYRLRGLLQKARLPVWHWHGDVSSSHKARLLKQPSGVLQITPESLESLLINKPAELVRLFGGLRFVVIDEVHIFMGSDRGQQVLCQLARLEQLMQKPPRRIGLSATLGDHSMAAEWLGAGTTAKVSVPELVSKQRIRLALEHFFTPAKAARRSAEEEVSEPFVAGEAAYHRFLFESSKVRQKTLIFANNRAETENVITNIRQVARIENDPDIYHVHHGSVAAPVREAAEQAMRNPEARVVVAATLTLELGIDIGQLERVIQLGAPFSVSSFLQRLGRSGRRGKPAEMWFVCDEGHLASKSSLPELIPWALLQSIAIIQLYVEEKWIEPLVPAQYPFSLLYHQTMSTLANTGELSPAGLAQRVLTLPPFKHISPQDYRSLLRHLLSIDHIQQTEKGRLIIGLTGEKIVRNFRFYAVFRDNQEYSVKSERGEVGSIVYPPAPGERFGLAGKTWEVEEINRKRKIVFVKPVEGRASASWRGSAGLIHGKILTRMRKILFEETQYPYLMAHASQRLKEARQFAKHLELDKTNLIGLGDQTFCIFPWLGTVAYRTLNRYLEHFGKEYLEIDTIGGLTPYYLTVRQQYGDRSALRKLIKKVNRLDLTPLNLLDSTEAPKLAKYDEFIPPDLRRKAFAADHLKLKELQDSVRKWRRKV